MPLGLNRIGRARPARQVGVSLFVGAALVLSACGDANVDESGLVMGMFDNRYRPDDLVVSAGDTVEFPNEGNVDHNVIDVDGAFDSRIDYGGDHKPDETWTYTFTEPGTYNIYCSLHAVKNNNTGEWTGMVATITVEDTTEDTVQTP